MWSHSPHWILDKIQGIAFVTLANTVDVLKYQGIKYYCKNYIGIVSTYVHVRVTIFTFLKTIAPVSTKTAVKMWGFTCDRHPLFQIPNSSSAYSST